MLGSERDVIVVGLHGDLWPGIGLDHPDDAAGGEVEVMITCVEPGHPIERGRQLVAAAEAYPPIQPARLTVDLGDLTAVMAQLEVRPLADGRIALELPRSAATALGGLLRALASAVESNAGPPAS